VQNNGWIHDADDYIKAIGLNDVNLFGPLPSRKEDTLVDFSSGIANKIFSIDNGTFQPIPAKRSPKYYPIWQQSPPYHSLVNDNFVEAANYGPFVDVCAATGDIVLGDCEVYPPGNVSSPHPFTSVHAFMLSYAAGEYVEYRGDPITPIFLPVFDSYNEDRKLVAVMYALIAWKSYFFNILPKNVEPIVVILANSCHGPFTYIIDGPDVQFVGAGDFHSSNMEQYAAYVDLEDLLSESINGISLNQDVCQYNLTVYPTESNYNQYNTGKLDSWQEILV
jgi:hypothetical protein